MDVEEQRARRIGGVRRMHLAAGEPPQQETIDGAEGKFARFRLLARAFDMVEQPGDLGAGEIGIEQQPGLLGEQRLVALGFQRSRKDRRCAGPARRWRVDGLARLAVPHERRFALIGDADGGDVARLRPRLWRARP